MGNPVVHWELMSKEPAKLADFYAKLFGWTIRHRADIDYRNVETGVNVGINGGIVQRDRHGPWPGNMVLYVQVDDLEAWRRKVTEAGGEIHVVEQEVPGLGSFCLFTDPVGRMRGFWKPKPPEGDSR